MTWQGGSPYQPSQLFVARVNSLPRLQGNVEKVGFLRVAQVGTFIIIIIIIIIIIKKLLLLLLLLLLLSSSSSSLSLYKKVNLFAQASQELTSALMHALIVSPCSSSPQLGETASFKMDISWPYWEDDSFMGKG